MIGYCIRKPECKAWRVRGRWQGNLKFGVRLFLELLFNIFSMCFSHCVSFLFFFFFFIPSPILFLFHLSKQSSHGAYSCLYSQTFTYDLSLCLHCLIYLAGFLYHQIVSHKNINEHGYICLIIFLPKYFFVFS